MRHKKKNHPESTISPCGSKNYKLSYTTHGYNLKTSCQRCGTATGNKAGQHWPPIMLILHKICTSSTSTTILAQTNKFTSSKIKE
jgi:hypothetical protein